jgi:hypothetical protein
MLGPRVLASQTCVLFLLYGAAERQVHALLRCPSSLCLALSFLRLKRGVSGERKNQ